MFQKICLALLCFSLLSCSDFFGKKKDPRGYQPTPDADGLTPTNNLTGDTGNVTNTGEEKKLLVQTGLLSQESTYLAMEGSGECKLESREAADGANHYFDVSLIYQDVGEQTLKAKVTYNKNTKTYYGSVLSPTEHIDGLMVILVSSADPSRFGSVVIYEVTTSQTYLLMTPTQRLTGFGVQCVLGPAT